MTRWNIALGLGAILGLLLLWRAQRSGHPFDLQDVLMDPATNKASLNALTIAFFAALSAWVIVDRELRNLPGVEEMLIAVLGIFVAGRTVATGINAFRTAPEGPTTVRETREVSIPSGGGDTSVNEQRRTE